MRKVTNVKPGSDYTLLLSFDNGEEKVYDVKPHLDFGIFSQLKDQKIFNSVTPCLGSIRWSNNADIDPDTLYLDSKLVGNSIAAEPKQKYGKNK
jgi:hypothetical protein